MNNFLHDIADKLVEKGALLGIIKANLPGWANNAVKVAEGQEHKVVSHLYIAPIVDLLNAAEMYTESHWISTEFQRLCNNYIESGTKDWAQPVDGIDRGS